MSWQSHRVSELTQIWSSTQLLTLVSDLISMSQFIMTSSETDDEHHQHDVSKWARDEYYYLAKEFNQDKEYTWEIEQTATTLWVQQT